MMILLGFLGYFIMIVLTMAIMIKIDGLYGCGNDKSIDIALSILWPFILIVMIIVFIKFLVWDLIPLIYDKLEEWLRKD